MKGGKTGRIEAGRGSQRQRRGLKTFAGGLDWGHIESLKGGKTGRIEPEQRITFVRKAAWIGVSRQPERWENL